MPWKLSKASNNHLIVVAEAVVVALILSYSRSHIFYPLHEHGPESFLVPTVASFHWCRQRGLRVLACGLHLFELKVTSIDLSQQA